jgi:alkylation response protein AidB-like acyl-CoA dehydrogenase
MVHIISFIEFKIAGTRGARAMDVRTASSNDLDEAARLFAAAEGFVPRIRELAPRMRAERRLDAALVEDMEAAGLFSVIVPKRWGGSGLGPHEACRITEVIGTADISTGWVASFYILHNWFLCKFPLAVQETLFAERNSVRTPAVFGPPGAAERVAGGYRVTGRWPYGTGAMHCSHVMVPAMVGQEMHWFIAPRDQVELVDDWRMEAMSATGSVTIAARDLFVADDWHCDINRLVGISDYPGLGLHDEFVYRLPFTALLMVSLSPCLGGLDRAVQIARERLPASMPLGLPRIQRAGARVRWAEAYETSRVMRLIRDGVTDEVIRNTLSGEPATLKDEARAQLHLVRFVHGIKDALRLLLDGLGSSTYRADDPIFCIAQDVSVLATHAHGPDYDVVMDRHARLLLDIGMEAGDPGTRLT